MVARSVCELFGVSGWARDRMVCAQTWLQKLVAHFAISLSSSSCHEKLAKKLEKTQIICVRLCPSSMLSANWDRIPFFCSFFATLVLRMVFAHILCMNKRHKMRQLSSSYKHKNTNLRTMGYIVICSESSTKCLLKCRIEEKKVSPAPTLDAYSTCHLWKQRHISVSNSTRSIAISTYGAMSPFSFEAWCVRFCKPWK